MEGGSALDDRVVSPQELFTLGGFLELSGLPRDALIGTQYGHRAHDRLSPRQPRRHRASSSSRPTSAPRSRPATSGRPATTWTGATSKTGGSLFLRRGDARSGRCTSPAGFGEGGVRRSTCCSARRSERRRTGVRGRMRHFPATRLTMATCHDHNLREPLPETASRTESACGCAAATRSAISRRRLAEGALVRDARRSASSALERDERPVPLLPPGDAPALDFERVDP